MNLVQAGPPLSIQQVTNWYIVHPRTSGIADIHGPGCQCGCQTREPVEFLGTPLMFGGHPGDNLARRHL